MNYETIALTIHNNENSLFTALNMVVCSWCCKTRGG